MTQSAINQKYDLELSPIALGDHQLDIYTVADWTPFIETLKQNLEHDTHDSPFWFRIWEAAMVLSDHLLRQDLDLNSRILEIGAGMGIVGLFLAARGHKVTITDYEDDALDLLAYNARHLGLNSVTIQKLDWLAPQIDHQFDLICGSELVYREDVVDPLIKLLRQTLKPEGIVYLAHDARRQNLKAFIQKLPPAFAVRHLGKTLRAGDDVQKIVIQEITYPENRRP